MKETLLNSWQSFLDARWFIEILVALALVAVLTITVLFTRKLGKKMFSAKNKAANRGAIRKSSLWIWLLGIATLVSLVLVNYFGLWKRVGIIAGVVLGTVLIIGGLVFTCFRFFRKEKPDAEKGKEKDAGKGKEKDKNGSESRWEQFKTHVGFAVLWAIIIGVGNYLLYRLHSSVWSTLLNYEGSLTLWGTVNVLFIFGISFAVNSKHTSIKVLGVILFLMGLGSWVGAVREAPSIMAKTASKPAILAEADAIKTLETPIHVPVPGPETRWSSDQTFKGVKRGQWSVELNSSLYEVDDGVVEVMINGNEKDVHLWDTSAPPDKPSFHAPSYTKFVQIRSTVKDEITVYGNRYKGT